MGDNRTIGIFDSGVGGLTVVRALRKILPGEDFVYLGDTARAPYGTKGKQTIARYASECTQFLVAREAKLIIVACNTASALALEDLQQQIDCPLLGVIEPAVASVLENPTLKSVAVIGTEATIKSSAYQNALLAQRADLQVFAKACPLFVSLVEEGILEGEIVERVIDMYLAELKAKSVDAVILACTHYPLLKPALERYFGQQTKLIGCAGAVARQAKSVLEAQQALNQKGGLIHKFFVTDDVQRFNNIARIFLADSTVSAAQIELVLE